MTSSYLHITNGDGAAGQLLASSIEGDVLPWQDTMHDGPFPQGLNLDEVSKIRARYLAGPGFAYEDVVRDFNLRNERIKAADKYDKVILWFEHDLLDQLQILQILDWFYTTEFDIDKLSMICIDRFKGVDNFRGLGQLSPQQISSLIDIDRPLLVNQLKLASQGWAAFRNPDPQELLAFLEEKLDALPFLGASLLRHLEEYPWQRDGLNRSERQILQLVAENVSTPEKLFQESMNCETVFFMGDWNLFSHVATLANAELPLLVTETGNPFIYPRDLLVGSLVGDKTAFTAQKLSLTKAGENVLNGSLHARDVLKRDFHLGGVHIQSDDPMWRWNDQLQTLERHQS